MTSELQDEIIERTEGFLKIKSKLEQAIRIRQNLIVRKLQLLEEFEKYPKNFMEKNEFKDLLKRYEVLHKKEVNIMKIFRKGIDYALHTLKILKNKCGWFGRYKREIPYNTKNDIKFTFSVVKKIDERLRVYEERMEYEEELLENLEGNLDKKVDLMNDIIKIFKKEVRDDLMFVMESEKNNKKLLTIKENLENELRRAKGSTQILFPVGASVSIATISIGLRGLIHGSSNNPSLIFFGLLAAIATARDLIRSMCSVERKKIDFLSKFVKSNKIKKIRIY